MAVWMTNPIDVDPVTMVGYGNRSTEWWRYSDGFAAELPEGVYILRVVGTITVALDPSTGSSCEIRTGVTGNPYEVVGRLLPGDAGTFDFDSRLEPAIGPLGEWDTVFTIGIIPDGGLGSAVSATITGIQLRYELSDVAPGPGPDPDPEGATAYNCACDDDYPRTTLKQMRDRIATRLGFATQVAMGVLPPGMAELLDDFIRNAQEMLYRRYAVFRMERFYVWDMEPGVRFYDFDANADACPKRMDPRMVSWAGVSQGDLSWRPLVCGIDPVMYGSPGSGIPSHYEIRQCIEVWPAPVDDTWKLRIKGHFGLLPLEADSDETTIDPEAIFLQALANAKAHYGQPDAGNYAAQAAAYVRSLVAGSHHTRRYIPGSAMPPPAVRPVLREP